MSQHSGGRLDRPHTPDKPGRPSLERPSLFAGMDNEPSSFDGDTQRVRILSTLESTRRPARGPMKIRGITKKKRSNWQAKALFGLMAVGVLSLLTSFVLVLVNGHAPSARSDAADQAARPGLQPAAAQPVTASSASADNPLASLIAPPARPDASAVARPAQVAVIENVAIAMPALSPSPGNAPDSQHVKAKAEAAKPTTMAQATPATTQPPPQATKSVQTAGKRAQAGGRSDEDVALLEAMFAHTRPRAATEPAADEIKRRCSGLSGPDAATCRARVCVQSPTAAVCHQD